MKFIDRVRDKFKSSKAKQDEKILITNLIHMMQQNNMNPEEFKRTPIPTILELLRVFEEDSKAMEKLNKK